MAKRAARRRMQDTRQILAPHLSLVEADVQARTDRSRKHWSIHDLKSIKPLTEHQSDMFQAYFQGSQVCAMGTAGTGKTFLAVYLAMTDVLHPEREQDHIVIVRSAVPSRDQGFLPGDLEEKGAVYELPYVDIFAELFGRSKTYEDMKEAGVVQFATTSYIRGLTWNNAVVIVEEWQNMKFEEIDTIMTRIGRNTRVIFAGDSRQTDLCKRDDISGFGRFVRAARRMNEFAFIEFTKEDIVRGELVKSWIIASEETA